MNWWQKLGKIVKEKGRSPFLDQYAGIAHELSAIDKELEKANLDSYVDNYTRHIIRTESNLQGWIDDPDFQAWAGQRCDDMTPRMLAGEAMSKYGTLEEFKNKMSDPDHIWEI